MSALPDLSALTLRIATKLEVAATSECSICLGALNAEKEDDPWTGVGPFAFAPCQQMVHVFHKMCIKQLLAVTPDAACPDCKSPFQPNVKEVLGLAPAAAAAPPREGESAPRDSSGGLWMYSEGAAREVELARRARVAAERARREEERAANPQAARRRWWFVSVSRP